MFDDEFADNILMEEAYRVYVGILKTAIESGSIEDPLKMVGLFLGINMAETIMYQKLIDSGCTIESIEKSKEKVLNMSQEIIAQVKGKFVVTGDDEKV